MLVSSEVQKRIQVLSEYISNVSDSIDQRKFRTANSINRDNKSIILNTILSQHSPKTNLLDSLRNHNLKLRNEIELLSKKRKHLQTHNSTYNFGVDSGIKEEKVRIVCVRFRITLADLSKMDFDDATISGDFDALSVDNHSDESENSLFFTDFVSVEKKNVHILLQFERN